MRYKDLMFSFSREDLKRFLGQDMVDTLIEWTPSGDDLLTRERLIDMIILLHGTNILKNRDFRKALLFAMKEREIKEIRDDCLSGSELTEDNVFNLVNIIASKPWSKNKVSLKLLNIWEYPETVFDKQSEDMTVESQVDIEDQFYELLD